MGGDAPPNERRAVAKAIVFGNLEGRSAERTEWEGEIVDRLCTDRHPGVWHNGGSENDGVKG